MKEILLVIISLLVFGCMSDKNVPLITIKSSDKIIIKDFDYKGRISLDNVNNMIQQVLDRYNNDYDAILLDTEHSTVICIKTKSSGLFGL